MERSPPLVMVVLVVIACCCGLAGGQTRAQSIGGILPRPPIIRPPAIPRDAILEPVARPPAIPRNAGEPRPPAPPPNTERACVVRHIENGVFKKECIDIASKCQQRQCPPDTVCALNLSEEIDCFPESVKQFQNCRPDFFRLSQPCPQDAGIRGFGMGCNYCVGANPFRRAAEPPSARRLIGGGPLEVLPPAPIGPRACVVSFSDKGESTRECIDISVRCNQMRCPSGTICALDLDNNMQCFPDSVKDLENCRSEEFRLSQPCPPDTGIRGFGMGCTFCVGGNPFLPGPEPPSVLFFEPGSGSRRIGAPAPPPQPPGPPSVMTNRACMVVHVKDGEFKSECVDISDKCALQNCPPGNVCGLNHDEEVTCFPESVRENQNCGPEDFRLSQPCAADMGITGFGMGCTFCFGANPFMSRSLSRRQLNASPEEPSASDSACVVRFIGGGVFKKECKSIAAECEEKQCPENTVCGLDLDENTKCFDASVKGFENCGPDEFRLQQPCPADAGIRGFGMGCTFCGGANPFGGEPPVKPEPPVPEPVGPPTPVPGPAPGQTVAAGSDQSIVNRLACVSRITNSGAMRRGCMDITDLCRRRGCPTDRTCALDINEQPSCFAASQLPISNCGTTRDRVAQPCPPGAELVAFGAGCTFCRLPPTSPPPPAANALRRACVVSGAVRRCEAIEARCADLACAETCALGMDGEARCFAAAELPAATCGPERSRLDQPCAAGMTAVAFGAGCTYCRPL